MAENNILTHTHFEEKFQNGIYNEGESVFNENLRCGFIDSNLGDREKMFLNGILNNLKGSQLTKESPKLVRQPSYSEVGILNYFSGINKLPAVKSDEEKIVAKSKADVPNGDSNNESALNKPESCRNVLSNSLGDREKMFINGVMRSNIEFPETANKKSVTPPSYIEHGILNYESQITKNPNSEDIIEKNDTTENGISLPNKIVTNKTQSSGDVFRNSYGNRESMFLSGIINNGTLPENQIKPKPQLVRLPSYHECGILNYNGQIFKKPKVDESPSYPNETSSASKIVTKTQSCDNVFRNSYGNRESMFLSGIMNNENNPQKPKKELVRQPSYSEYGILNYRSQLFPKPKSENGITPPGKVVNKTQSCENVFRNTYGNRESIFTSGIINNVINSEKEQQTKRQLLRQPSYSEHGILNYESQIFTNTSSNPAQQGPLSNDLNSPNFKTCNGDSPAANGSTNCSQENGSNNESPARSRIVARVKKSRSFAVLSDSPEGDLPECTGSGHNERKVLVIYTGGTIGMVKNTEGVLEPIKGAFEDRARSFPQLHEQSYWRKRFCKDDNERDNLVLPAVKDLDTRIIYKIHEKDVLLDSSNITSEEWVTIARYIEKNYDLYDGFVVLHGTDTLAYTASALSFMLENLGKPVVVTGSQIPIFEPRSDGSDNFVSALIVAGGLNIPEVTVLFGSKLFRGNRTRKISSHNFHAFDSPNFIPLVEFGIDIELNSKAIFRPNTIERCRLHERMSKNVGIIRIFPSITSAILRAFLQPPIEGVVIESYGSGNIPSNKDIFREIEEAVNRGVIVVNITQCASGSVAAPVYETGRLIQACGVISGYDMTAETALAKLAYVLTKDDWSRDKKIEMMTSNIRGELTNLNSITIEDNSLIDALASSLKIASPKQLIEVTDKVFTALLLYAIDKEEEVTIQRIQELGAEVNSQNCEGKTPLHEAIYKENVNIVKYLLLRGANVHVKTRSGESPLFTAIQRDHHAIIRLLLNCGANLTSSDNQVVTELLSLAARRGAVQRLESLKVAGADFGLRDEMGQTALHKAVLSNQPDAVRFLVDQNIKRDVQDVLGQTPLHYAKQLGHQEMIAMLE